MIAVDNEDEIASICLECCEVSSKCGARPAPCQAHFNFIAAAASLKFRALGGSHLPELQRQHAWICLDQSRGVQLPILGWTDIITWQCSFFLHVRFSSPTIWR